MNDVEYQVSQKCLLQFASLANSVRIKVSNHNLATLDYVCT